MNPHYTKGIAFIVVLTSIFVSSAIADSKREKEECPQQLVDLATCLLYKGGQAKSLPPDCCSGLCPREERAHEFASADADDVYSTWLLKYPSALTSFEQITNHAKGKRIALFLDYDGTLSPIVENPDRAFMSENMRAAVKKAAKYFPTAIISGRSRDKVYKFVGLTELYYAGSHGMDIIGPVRQSVSDNHPNCIRSTDNQGKEVNLFQPAAEFLPMIDEVLTLLVDRTKDIEGAKVENNTFCVSVHYRNVNEKNWDTVEQRVRDILEDYPRLRLTHGRKVLEIRPAIDWDKGKAVTFLLESLGLNNCEDVLPMYVGDDQTDEDAFKVLRKETRGYGILVSSKPKETNAVYSLRDPSEVMEFLKSLVALQDPKRLPIVYRIIDTWFVLLKSLLATVNSLLITI